MDNKETYTQGFSFEGHDHCTSGHVNLRHGANTNGEIGKGRNRVSNMNCKQKQGRDTDKNKDSNMNCKQKKDDPQREFANRI